MLALENFMLCGEMEEWHSSWNYAFTTEDNSPMEVGLSSPVGLTRLSVALPQFGEDLSS